MWGYMMRFKLQLVLEMADESTNIATNICTFDKDFTSLAHIGLNTDESNIFYKIYNSVLLLNKLTNFLNYIRAVISIKCL
jgi:hypothetical protein